MVGKVLIASRVIALLFRAVVVHRFAFFILPFRWTGELDRLASLLQLHPGSVVADMGAGDGAFARAIAERLDGTGLVFATELSSASRETIRKRVESAAVPNVTVVEATATDTNLADTCCDAAYLGAVVHHVGDRERLGANSTRQSALADAL